MNKYKTLTPLRAVQLLESIDNKYTDEWKLERCKEALREHVKAFIVRKEKREGA